MGKVLDFNKKKKAKEAKKSPEDTRMFLLRGDFDRAIHSAVKSGTNPVHILGVLAHTMGTYLGKFNGKERLWDTLQNIVESEADL